MRIVFAALMKNRPNNYYEALTFYLVVDHHLN